MNSFDFLDSLFSVELLWTACLFCIVLGWITLWMLVLFLPSFEGFLSFVFIILLLKMGVLLFESSLATCGVAMDYRIQFYPKSCFEIYAP